MGELPNGVKYHETDYCRVLQNKFLKCHTTNFKENHNKYFLSSVKIKRNGNSPIYNINGVEQVQSTNSTPIQLFQDNYVLTRSPSATNSTVLYTKSYTNDVKNVGAIKGVSVSSADSKRISFKKNSEFLQEFKNNSTFKSRIVKNSGADARQNQEVNSFTAKTEIFQNTEEKKERSRNNINSLLDKQKQRKSKESKYFYEQKQSVDTVNVVNQTSKTTNNVNVAKVGKVGVVAVDTVSSALLSVTSQQDDLGSQSISKGINAVDTSTRLTHKIATRKTRNTAKATATKQAKKTVKKATKTKKVAKYGYKAVETTKNIGKAVASAVRHLVSAIATNPYVALVVFVIVFVLIAVILLASVCGGGILTSSYGGNGTDESMSVNDYVTISDYIQKSIAKRNLELLNLQDTYTGYLKYDYKYKIKNDDGTTTETSTYPVADISPILAYLSVNYQTYTLTDTLKKDIDNIVNDLYTFSTATEKYTSIVNHGSYKEENTGEKIIFTITHLNASTYFEKNNLIDEEKLTQYSAIKDYGDYTYKQMYNIFNDKDFKNYIIYPYGYSIKATYIFENGVERYDYELVEHKTTALSLKNKNDESETAEKLYSPINGKVSQIVSNDEFENVVTIYDSENKLTFVLYGNSDLKLNIKSGDTVTNGQLIGTRSSTIEIKTKVDNKDTNPLFIMETTRHTRS